jgi:hypothetical protein
VQSEFDFKPIRIMDELEWLYDSLPKEQRRLGRVTVVRQWDDLLMTENASCT